MQKFYKWQMVKPFKKDFCKNGRATLKEKNYRIGSFFKIGFAQNKKNFTKRFRKKIFVKTEEQPLKKKTTA